MMTEDQLRRVVGEAISEKLDGFLIERERHFKDHEFITDVRVMGEKVKGQACKVVTTSGIMGFGTLLIWGIIKWIGEIMKGRG